MTVTWTIEKITSRFLLGLIVLELCLAVWFPFFFFSLVLIALQAGPLCHSILIITMQQTCLDSLVETASNSIEIGIFWSNRTTIVVSEPAIGTGDTIHSCLGSRIPQTQPLRSLPSHELNVKRLSGLSPRRLW